MTCNTLSSGSLISQGLLASANKRNPPAKYCTSLELAPGSPSEPVNSNGFESIVQHPSKSLSLQIKFPIPDSPPNSNINTFNKFNMTEFIGKRQSSSTPRDGVSALAVLVLSHSTNLPPPSNLDTQPTMSTKSSYSESATIVERGFGTFIIDSEAARRVDHLRAASHRVARVQAAAAEAARNNLESPFLGSHITVPPREPIQRIAGVLPYSGEYPPLFNKAYAHSMHGVKYASIISKPVGCGALNMKAHASTNISAVDVATGTSAGELAARKIQWDRHFYNDGEMGPSPEMLHSTTPLITARKTFVDSLNNAQGRGEEAFEYCNKCKKRHIVYGPPLTLQDRDTCQSLLPEWFPKEQFEDGEWGWFKELFNEVVRLEETKQGRLKFPAKGAWDKTYHEPDERWRELGRAHGGWWKCRASYEVENISWREYMCKECHGPKNLSPKEESEVKKREQIRMDREDNFHVKQWVLIFIENAVKKQMEKDRSFVETRWKAEGI